MKQPYTPPLLPPEFDIARLLSLTVDAREAVARYDEAIKRLPNPMIIKRSFETKEALLSSKIEGTQATLEEVMEFDVKANKDESTEKLRDYQEIANYRQAISQGILLLKEKPLSENVIKDLHRTLLNSVRGKNKEPGEFRRHQVHIGPAGATLAEATYIPPVSSEIPELFSNLVNYLQNDEQPDRLIQAGIMHYQFEAIHPFADGNGRVGRLIIPIYLYEKGLTATPNLYISEFLETHRRDYYEALSKVTEEGDWITWLSFFLRAIREQAKTLKKRVDEVETLYKELHQHLPDFNSIYASTFLDAIFTLPFFRAKDITDLTQINGATLYNLLQKFVDADVIEDITPAQTRNKLYCFSKLLNIINQ